MVCKTSEDKKIETMNIQHNSLTQCSVEFLHWVIPVLLKIFCLKLGSHSHSFNKFLYYNQKDLWLAPFCKWNFLVNSAGDSFCWNYATDTFYSNYTGAGANIHLLQLCRFWGCIAIMQMTVSVAITQLEISATFTQLNVFATNILVTIFIEIMHVEGIFSSALCAWLFLL